MQGHWEFNLEDPFERAVSIMMIELVSSHATFDFNRFDFDPRSVALMVDSNPQGKKKAVGAAAAGAAGGGGVKQPNSKAVSSASSIATNNKNSRNLNPMEPKPNPAAKHVDVYIDVSTDKASYFNDQQMKIVTSLQRVKDAAGNIRKAVHLFAEMDEDGSGQLEANEFSTLLANMGMSVSEEIVRDIIEQYDADLSTFLTLYGS